MLRCIMTTSLFFQFRVKGRVYCNVVDCGFLLRMGFGLAAALLGIGMMAAL